MKEVVKNIYVIFLSIITVLAVLSIVIIGLYKINNDYLLDLNDTSENKTINTSEKKTSSSTDNFGALIPLLY